MKRISIIMLALIVVLCYTSIAGELKTCVDSGVSDAGPVTDIAPPLAPDNGEAFYSGTIRVFLVEPVARWTDYSGYYYRNGFLDFAIVSNVNLDDGEVVYRTAVWDASTTNFEMIFEANIMAIGVLFRSEQVPTDADPPSGMYFQARYADAAASAIPGLPGSNQAQSPFTHNVFIEESTATT